jgi:hypothetical protein
VGISRAAIGEEGSGVVSLGSGIAARLDCPGGFCDFVFL